MTKWFSECEGMTESNGSDLDALAPAYEGQRHLAVNP